MGLSDEVNLTDAEYETIGQALRAVVDGPFFSDIEFHPIFGVDRDMVGKVADKWPHVDLRSEVVDTVVNNSLLNLLGYPHGMRNELPKYISAPREELSELLDKWRQQHQR